MYMSKMFIPTLREVPAEAECLSHQLMLRAGLIRKVASGVYSYLPLGYKVIKNIQTIVREEMDNAGAQEILMPALLPIEPYEKTDRVEAYGPNMFKLKDRHDRDFCLGPTHEEIFAEIVKGDLKSYRQLPFMLYQIQTKYRDEKRPRSGLIRCREFIMKDAYSFDKDHEGLDVSYNAMHNAYVKIYERLGVNFKIVQADSGAMGGSASEEFMVESEIGEDTLVVCEKCSYASNIEKAECITVKKIQKENMLEIEKVHTPNIKTINDLVDFFGVAPENFVKTILYKADKEIVAVLVRGDREINEVKLKNLLGCNEDVEMVDEQTVESITNAKVGFAGPKGLKIKIVADNEILNISNFIVGANQTDFHYKNVNVSRDFKVDIVSDIRNIQAGEPCPHCSTPVTFAKGIEVGHIFKLGTKYATALECNFLDENGNQQPVVMGSYGIGVSRLLSVLVEQNSDEFGIIWSMSITPYHVMITPINVKDEIQFNLAKEIYESLKKEEIEVVLDDRDERPGVKFKDADLIGFPIRITVGKKAAEGVVEFKERKNDKIDEINIADVVERVMSIITR